MIFALENDEGTMHIVIKILRNKKLSFLLTFYKIAKKSNTTLGFTSSSKG